MASLAAAAVGTGFAVQGGILGAQGAQVSAEGKQIGIQGQMLQTMGQANQMDVEAANYGTKANMADYQAAVADQNRKIALQNADYSRVVGDVQASESGMKTAAEIGTAKAYQAASGVNVNTGSAVDVRTSMTQLGYYDQQTIRANAAKTAWGYDVEATQDEAQGALYSLTAATDRASATAATAAAGVTRAALPLEQQAYGLAGKAGDIAAQASIVSAASSVADKWIGAFSKGISIPGVGSLGFG
jgi:hypothetical protein